MRRHNANVFRVGKANTLLLTPNDWSTLSNGTVDGEPTGLHRFVGENRFVFVLLNVTDGHGDLVSYDLETRETSGSSSSVYTDLSGNGHTGSLIGSVTPDRGAFGLAARLGASGSYVQANGGTTRLNWINASMTVAAWIRPDTDYVSQSGWQWSLGRTNLWRLGFTGGSVRFEVKDTNGGLHAAQATYALYAGRWVHLAATMTSGATWTNLSAYADGALIAWKNESAYAAKDDNDPLFVGYDAVATKSFHGLVDEFRLYKTSLSQDSVRGLAWLLHGANNVIVPRGVFFDSKLFASLNASAYDPNSPLAGANVNGNDNKGTASLNARVIQMVITKNATLAQAWSILSLAATNSTGNVTAFALFVANEFYTLGLAKEVRDLAANVVVENSGNVSAPPPSPSLWQLFWNTIAGIAGAAWNALVAVGAFFQSIGEWLVDALVGIFLGLVTGNWTYFQENVLDPLIEALNSLVAFMLEFVGNLFRGIFETLLAVFRPVIGRIGSLWLLGTMGFLGFLQTGNLASLSDVKMAMSSLSDDFAPIIAVIAVITIAFLVIQFALGPVSFLISMAIGLIIGIVAQQLITFMTGPQGLLGLLQGGDLSSVLSLFGLDVVSGTASEELPPALHTREGDLATACLLFFVFWLVLIYGISGPWDRLMSHRQDHAKIRLHVGDYKSGASKIMPRIVAGLYGTVFTIASALSAPAAWAEDDEEMRQVWAWGSFLTGIAGFVLLMFAGPFGQDLIHKVSFVLSGFALATGIYAIASLFGE